MSGMRWRAGMELDELPGEEIVEESFARDGVHVLRVRTLYEPFPWSAPTLTDSWGIGLVRYGAYVRRPGSIEHLVDVNTGFFRHLLEEVSVLSFTGEPEELTIVELDADVLDQVPDLSEARGPFHVTPRTDLAHRLLVRSLAVGAPDVAVQSAVVDLLHEAVRDAAPGPRGYSRKSTETDRRRLVRRTCELMHTADTDMSLIELARHVGSSPFHLSRVFREITGTTITQYRQRLRVHQVLDRLTHGEDDLAAIAISAGFADHSHMTRTVVTQLGQPPSTLRKLLRDSPTECA
jgi:AraC-like DNA-binding protein